MVEVAGSLLIIDSQTAFPCIASDKRLKLGAGGYGAFTAKADPSASFATSSPADFMARVSTLVAPDATAIIGFDSSTPATSGVTLPAGVIVDLNNLPVSVYIGTTSQKLTIPADAILKGRTSDEVFKLAAFQGGTIDLSANFLASNNVRDVVFGLPDRGMAFDPSTGARGNYILRSATNESTSTTIYNGRFQLASNKAFGTGPITIMPDAEKVSIAPFIDVGNGIYSNIVLASGISINAQNSVLQLGSTSGGPPAPLTINGDISGSARIEITGNVTLGGSNSFVGGSNIGSEIQSTITLTNDNALGSGAVNLGQYANLIFATASPQLNNLNGSAGSSIFLANGANLTLTQQGRNKYSTSIVGGTSAAPTVTTASVTLNQDTGVVTDVYSPTSNYSGGTTVNGGVVVVRSSGTPLGTGTITLNGAALMIDNPAAVVSNALNFTGTGNRLAGNGTFTGSVVTVGSGLTLTPGIQYNWSPEVFSPSILKFNTNLDFSSGGSLEIMVKDPMGTRGGGYSSLDVMGTLNFGTGEPFNVSLINLDMFNQPSSGNYMLNQNYSLTIAHATNITNFSPAMLVFDDKSFNPNWVSTWSFSLANSNTDLVLNFTPVPEPETWAMMLGGSAILMLPLIRRRKSKSIKLP